MRDHKITAMVTPHLYCQEHIMKKGRGGGGETATAGFAVARVNKQIISGSGAVLYTMIT